jgi:hypothetical protein
VPHPRGWEAAEFLLALGGRKTPPGCRARVEPPEGGPCGMILYALIRMSTPAGMLSLLRASIVFGVASVM